MLQESPFAQTTGFPALPGVTPTKSGGRADKAEVPNLFSNPAQVRRRHSKCSQAWARQSHRQYSQAQALQRPNPSEAVAASTHGYSRDHIRVYSSACGCSRARIRLQAWQSPGANEMDASSERVKFEVAQSYQMARDAHQHLKLAHQQLQARRKHGHSRSEHNGRWLPGPHPCPYTLQEEP